MQKSGSDEGASSAGQPEETPPAPAQKSIDSGNGAEFQISLNEFLEFLKLSCHVNDMIAKATSDMGKPHTREPVPPMEGNAPPNATKRNSKKDEFDFAQLADNPLVNSLLGLRRPTRNSSIRHTDESRLLQEAKSSVLRSGHSHQGRPSRLESTYRGLHPKLGERLDAVINEGVLDSVLAFICPVPLPTQLQNGKNKPKQLQPPKELPTPTSPTPTSNLIPPAAPLPPGISKSLMELGHSHGSLPAATPSAPCLQQAHHGGDALHPDQSTNSMMRAMIKEPIPKPVGLNAGRRKSLLLVKDSKHARQERKE